MSAPEPEWRVELYTDERGVSPVLDFIDGLPVKEQARVRNVLRHLRELGTSIGMPYAKAIRGHRPLWELRPQPNRLLYFAQTGRRFIILHGLRKKGRKLPRRDIATAEWRLVEMMERVE
jgi:phage-related protein